MNFHDILNGPLGQRLSWTLLHFLWQGLLIGAGAAAISSLLSPSHTRGRYAVAMIGLVLMACCPLVTIAVLPVPAPKPVAVAPPLDLPDGKMPPSTSVSIPEDDQALPAPQPSRFVSMPPSAHRIVSSTPAAPAPVPLPIEPDWRERLARRTALFQPYGVMAWLAGVIALSGRLLMSVVAVRRLARGRLPVSAELAACAGRLAQRLGLSASPGIFVSRRIREAMLVGLWRPMVLLPAAWIAEMPADVLEAVIAHELAHMRRLDLWVNLLQRLVETLLFYHPAVWWLSRRASLLREMCADELAVEATGERMTYATVLELLGRRRLKSPAPQLAAGIGGRRMALFARVRNVLGAAHGDERLRWWPAGLLALLVPLGIWLASLGLCGDLTAKKATVGEKPKADSQTAKTSATAASDHECAETGEKSRDSSGPIAVISKPDHRESWLLSLKETLRIALRNSKAMRRIGATMQLVGSKDHTALSATQQTEQALDNNRLVIARGNTDEGLIEFEASVCNLVSDVETAYWDLFLQYRLLETAVQGRERALRAWQKDLPKRNGGKAEAAAREQYFAFRTRAEECQKQVYQSERSLRWLLGIAASDGRLIRPADNLSTAKLSVDWQKALSETIQRSPAIREARFLVKQRELELNAAEKYAAPADQNDISLAIQKRKDSIANANLAVARVRVKLTETEKEVVSELSFAVEGMDAAYNSSVTKFNRRTAAKRQLDAVEAAYGHGLNGVTFSDLLNAQQRLAQSESDYYRSLTDYAKAISLVHKTKGTLLDYDGIELAERSGDKPTTEPAKQRPTNPASKASSSAHDSREATSESAMPLDSILKRLAEEENRYNPIEITATSTYQHLNKEDSGMKGLVLKMETRERSVIAGDRLYHEKADDSQSGDGAKTSILSRHSFDGQWTRGDTEVTKSQSNEHTSANIILGRAEDYLWPLRAHMLLFHDEFVYYPSLSSFLASGWFNKHNGYAMTIEYLGDEQAEGLFCHKLKCALPTNGKVDKYILLWLARDRNLLPVRKEWHELRHSETLPTGVFHVTELREIRPGLWFPYKATDVAYRKEELRNGRLLLQWQRDVQIEKVVLAPPADEKLFSTIEVPKGTLVYVADRGGKTIGKFKQPQVGNIEISLDDFHAMQRAAQANVQDEYDPQDATAPKRKERIDAAFATLRADPPLAQKERIEAAVTVLQNYGIFQTNTKKWATAIRELITIGMPAIPRLIDELDHIDRVARQESELRALGFVLRGIRDPRAVPALIRALPYTLQRPSNDCGCNVDDAELQAFMQLHDNDPIGVQSSFSFGRPINEILPALQKLTGVVAIMPTEDGGREFGGIHGIFLSRDAKKTRDQRQLFLQFAQRWAGWWAKNWKQYVSDEQDAQLDETQAALDRFAKQIAAMPDGGQSPDVTPKASLTKAGDASAKTSATAAISPVPTIEQISATWMARQKRVRSAKVQWKQTEFIAKGTMPPPRPELFGQDEASNPKTSERQPPADVSLDCTQTVLVNGDMLRIDREGSYWHPHRGLQQDFKVDTFDGEVSKTFYVERTTHELDGFIQREARNHEYDCYLYGPIALAFRPCDPDMGGLNLKLCTINPSLETVDGRTCVVLVASNRTLWLDPLCEFNVLKFGDEARSWSCDISYQEDESHVWVPTQWKTIFTWQRDSKPRQQTVAKVTDYKLNADVPRSAFQFEFPVATYVSDSRKEPIERYIVRPGGKKRLITKEELDRGAGADYPELLRTESGMARGKPSPRKDKSPAANASPGKDWSMTSNDMRVRLLAPKGTTYRRGEVLPLVIELQNYGDKPIACNRLWHVVRFPAHDSDDNWIGEPVMGPELADSVGQTDLAPGKTTEVRLSLQSLRFNRPLKAGETIQLQACVSTQEGRLGQLPLEVLTPSVTIRVQDAFPPDIGAADFPDKWQMNLACELKMGLLGRRRLQIDEKGAAKVLNAYVSATRPAINNFVKVTLPPERLKELAIALRRMQAWKLSQIPRNPPPPDSEYIDFSLVCLTGASVVGKYATLDEQKEPLITDLQKLVEDLVNDVENAAKTSNDNPAENNKSVFPPMH